MNGFSFLVELGCGHSRRSSRIYRGETERIGKPYKCTTCHQISMIRRIVVGKFPRRSGRHLRKGDRHAIPNL